MNGRVVGLSVSFVVFFAASYVCGAEEAVEPTGKVILFDGKSLDVWVGVPGDGQAGKAWTIKEGGILAWSWLTQQPRKRPESVSESEILCLAKPVWLTT